MNLTMKGSVRSLQSFQIPPHLYALCEHVIVFYQEYANESGCCDSFRGYISDDTRHWLSWDGELCVSFSVDLLESWGSHLSNSYVWVPILRDLEVWRGWEERIESVVALNVGYMLVAVYAASHWQNLDSRLPLASFHVWYVYIMLILSQIAQSAPKDHGLKIKLTMGFMGRVDCRSTQRAQWWVHYMRILENQEASNENRSKARLQEEEWFDEVWDSTKAKTQNL